MISRQWYVAIETAVRAAFGTGGALLIVLARPVAARLTARHFVRALQIVIAIVLALVASELVLQRVRLRPAEWRAEHEEPHRRPDARLGWIFEPARTAYAANRAGRMIEYAFDANGYRVRSAAQPVDLLKPSNLFVGESVMFGDGLSYDDSVPARLEAMLGTPSINAAVYGYSTDQTYLKLEKELPRLRHPVNVVALFMTSLFGRNLDDDRPHLGPGLVWRPAEQHGRLMTLAGLLVPFRRQSTVDDGIAATRDVLRAVADVSRARGAAPLVVVPRFGKEAAPERALREAVLDGSGIPYLIVEIDPSWHIAWDHHPDAQAARAIAEAIAGRLRERSSRDARLDERQ